jgi:hypothetical protein
MATAAPVRVPRVKSVSSKVVNVESVVKADQGTEMKEAVIIMANGNGRKRDLPVINLTREEVVQLDAKGILEIMSPRVSGRRAKDLLISLVGDGTVSVTDPETLMDWTYKHVIVEGVSAETITGSKDPKVSLAAEKFKKLTGAEVAELLKEHTTESRAGKIMFALIGVGLQLTPEQVVTISNNRITVEGVELLKAAQRKKDSVILVKGVSINGK